MTNYQFEVISGLLRDIRELLQWQKDDMIRREREYKAAEERQKAELQEMLAKQVERAKEANRELAYELRANADAGRKGGVLQ